jgi:hypothetical protein
MQGGMVVKVSDSMKSSNQSLERTPLGWPVCMGLPCMVSLSSRRWAYKRIRMLLRLLLLIVFYCLLTHANAEESEASLKHVIPAVDCSEIDVSTRTGWWLRIKQDGSVQIGFGSSGGDDIILPTKSISFTEEHKKLSVLNFNNGTVADPSVAFVKLDYSTAYGLNTPDRQVIKELFLDIRNRAKYFNENTQLVEIWDKNPPIP